MHALQTVPANQDTRAIAANLAAYERNAAGAFSSNTERARRADTGVWSAWCVERGARSLPASPEAVAAFLEDQGATKTVATLRRYRASIAHMHRAAGVANPCDAEVVRLALLRLARARGTRQGQATALNRSAVDRMLGACGRSLVHRRDAALLAVAYDSMCRRSELVALEVADLVVADDGSATLLVRRSKADQEGQGRTKYLAPDTVRLLVAWMSAAGIEAGAIFRRLHRGGTVGERLHAGTVAAIFRAMAERAGVEAAGISGHSTRVGATQDQVAAGCTLPEVMLAGGWSSPAMPGRYAERLLAGQSAAAKLARAQGRA